MPCVRVCERDVYLRPMDFFTLVSLVPDTFLPFSFHTSPLSLFFTHNMKTVSLKEVAKHTTKGKLQQQQNAR